MNSQTYIFKKNIACKQLNSFKSDAILLQNEVNLFWYIGIKNLEGYCLITKKGDYLFVDQRYYFAIKKTFKFFSIVCFKNQKTLLQQILKLKIKSILIEADYLSVAQYDNLFFLFNQEKICLKKFVSRNMRIIKSDEEIEIMKESANIACNCIDYIKKQLKIGVTEIQIKNLILKYWINHHCDGPSFSPIVAFGKNSSIPHHYPTKKKLKMNENVKLDIGCIYQGYCSDITRTFIFGDKQKQKIYDLVLKANMTAIKSIKVGQKFTNIDSIAREIITKGGYGKNFTHYIGHGVGIEIHEKATENLKNDCILKNNMVFTIEPGIYLQNKYGVRIEDTIAIKNNKVIVLTRKAKK